MKYKCISKNRNADGTINSYTIMKEDGGVRTESKEEVKKAILEHKIEVVNLQIDKAGRLVDKAFIPIKESKEYDKSMEQQCEQLLMQVFDKMYNDMIHNKNEEARIMFGIVKLDNGDTQSISEDAVYESISTNPVFEGFIDRKYSNDFNLWKHFEKYIATKYNFYPNRLAVETKDGTFKAIGYSRDDIFIYSNSLSHIIKKNNNKYKYYTNISNYTYKGTCLNGQNNYSVQVSNHGDVEHDCIAFLKNGTTLDTMKQIKRSNNSTDKSTLDTVAKVAGTLGIVSRFIRKMNRLSK